MVEPRNIPLPGRKELEQIKEVVQAERRRSHNTPSRGRTEILPAEDYLAPETYIALTPPNGIPALLRNVGTATEPFAGTGTGNEQAEAGENECDIYRIDRVHDRPTLFALSGFEKTVYNITENPVPGNTWIIIVRDKFGSWLFTGYYVCAEPITFVTNVCPQDNGSIVVEYSSVDLLTCETVHKWCVTNPDSCCDDVVEGTSTFTPGTASGGPVTSPCIPGYSFPLELCLHVGPWRGSCPYPGNGVVFDEMDVALTFAGIINGYPTWRSSGFPAPVVVNNDNHCLPNPSPRTILSHVWQVSIQNGYLSELGQPWYCFRLQGFFETTSVGIIVDSHPDGTPSALPIHDGWSNSPVHWQWYGVSLAVEIHVTEGPCPTPGTATATSTSTAGDDIIVTACCPDGIAAVIHGAFSFTDNCECLEGEILTLTYNTTLDAWISQEIECGTGTIQFGLQCVGMACEDMELTVFCEGSVVTSFLHNSGECNCYLFMTYDFVIQLGNNATLCGDCKTPEVGLMFLDIIP